MEVEISMRTHVEEETEIYMEDSANEESDMQNIEIQDNHEGE